MEQNSTKGTNWQRKLDTLPVRCYSNRECRVKSNYNESLHLWKKDEEIINLDMFIQKLQLKLHKLNTAQIITLSFAGVIFVSYKYNIHLKKHKLPQTQTEKCSKPLFYWGG